MDQAHLKNEIPLQIFIHCWLRFQQKSDLTVAFCFSAGAGDYLTMAFSSPLA